MDEENQFEEDENTEVESPSMAVAKTNTSSRPWLENQLQEYSAALGAAEKNKSEVFKQATARLLEKQKQLEEPDWFGIAAALGKPTRTGTLGETFGNVNEVLSTQRRERRAVGSQLQDLMDKYKLEEADRKPSEIEKKLSLGIQLQKALPKEKQFEIDSLLSQIKDLPENDPKRTALQNRIDWLGGKRQAKSTETKPETPDQYALRILQENDANPGKYSAEIVARAQRILKAEAPKANETNEQWALRILDEEDAKPGTHTKDRVDRAKAIHLKQTYIPPSASKDEKPQTAEQYALEIVKKAKDKPGSVSPGELADARRILKMDPTEKAETNLSLEQWANKTLLEEEKKPGTHSKATLARARDTIRKANFIKAESGSGEGTPKAQSPAGKLAADRGFKPGTPEFAAEVKKIEQGRQHLSSTQEKELFEQEDIINGGQSALLSLDKALGLSPKAYEGGGAKARLEAGRWIPGVKDSDAQVASAEFDALIGEQALSQLKAIFGGNPTEGERKILMQLQGSLGMGHSERAKIISNAISAVKRRIKAANERIKGIKGGAYNRDSAEMAKGGPVRMQEGGTPPRRPPFAEPSGDYSAANFGRAVGQGLGMSFGDEAIARVRSKLEGRPYEDVLAEERAAYEAFAKKHPLTALGTEVASGILPTIGMAMIPGGQGAAGANIVRTAPTIGRLAASGGLWGGVSGFGAGEGDFTDRLPSAAKGAAFGTVAGPAFSKFGNLVGSGYRWAKDKLTPSVNSVDQAAMRKVLQAMGRDDMDIGAVRQRMARDQQLGVNSTMADVSPSVTSLAEAAVTVPGRGKKQLGQKLEERLAEGREGVAQRSQRDIAGGQNYAAKEDSLVSTLRRNARSVYEKAYDFGEVYDPRIMKVLDDDTFAKAYDKARSIISKEAKAAELRGEDVSKYKLRPIYNMDANGNWVRTGEVPDVQTLDYLKRGIDALIDQGYSADRSISKAEAGALKDLKNAFVNVIDEIVPDYKAARAQYRGDAEVLDALRFGREEFLSPKFTPDQVIKQLQGMSQAERDSMRVGVSQSILSKILETPNQINAAQRVIGAPSTRKRLAALFDDPNEYKIFEEALMRESQIFRNAQDILRGSRTQMKKQAIDDLKAAPGILDVAGTAVDFANAAPGNVLGRVLKFLQNRTSMDEKTANEVATMLKSSSPQEINAVLDKLEQSAGRFAREAERSSTLQKGITRGVGKAAGEPPRSPEPERPQETDEQRLERLLREDPEDSDVGLHRDLRSVIPGE